MQSLTRSQLFLNYNFKYAKMSSFVVFCEVTFAQLTPEEIAELQSNVQTLEPMNMELFNKKFKIIDENYCLILPPWAILGGQIASDDFILIEISLMAWFCLKHRKSIGTLLKLGFTLARKIQKDPKIIKHLVQQAKGLVANITPPDPPLRPPSTSAECAATVPKPDTKEHVIEEPSTSVGVHSPSLLSKAHHHTLEFITEAAQELYTKGQLHIKPYTGYLKKER